MEALFKKLQFGSFLQNKCLNPPTNLLDFFCKCPFLFVIPCPLPPPHPKGFLFLELGILIILMVTRLAWNSNRSVCLWLQTAGIKSLCSHKTRPIKYYKPPYAVKILFPQRLTTFFFVLFWVFCFVFVFQDRVSLCSPL